MGDHVVAVGPALEQRGEASSRRLRRRERVKTGERLHQRGQGPPCAPAAGGGAPHVQDVRGVERRREFGHETGAAAPGLTGDQDRGRAPVGDHAIEPRAEVGELCLSTDERSVPSGGGMHRGRGDGLV